VRPAAVAACFAVGLLGASVALAVVIVALVDAVLASSPALLQYLDAHRPHRSTVPLTVSSQAQLFHLHVLNRTTDVARIVPVIGSSSVVNGVDADRVNARLAERSAVVANFGITGLAAYELPFLREYYVPSGRRAVVLLYNPWMFPRDVYPSALRRRWHTGEALALFGTGDWHTEHLPRYASGMVAQVSPAFRFNELLKTQLVRWTTGRLTLLPTPYDYLDDAAEPPPVAGRRVPLASLDARLRRWYVESHGGDETLGWRGLGRFLDLARERGVRVVVAPVPTLPSEAWAYQQGLDLREVDAHVTRVAAARGAVVVDRAELPAFTYADFRDESHLRAAGRARFSDWLADAVMPRLGRP
jgi:hypothetical protein